MNEPQKAPTSSGLATVLNTIIAPKEAFESIRTAPTWGWAFIIAELLVLIGSIIVLPAIQHAFDFSWAAHISTNPRLSQMSADQLARAKSFAEAIVNIAPVFALLSVPIIMFVYTIIMLLFNALGRGSASFEKLWAATANIFIPGAGLGSIVLGIIVLVRGAATLNAPNAIQSLMPSLAMLAPAAPVKLQAFLSKIDPFTIWTAVLIVLAMLITANVPKLHAWLTGLVILLFPALLAAAFAR